MSHLTEASTNESREFIDPACFGSEHAEAIDLVGEKCMLKCLLNDCERDMLWDWCPGIHNISRIMPGTLGTNNH